MSNYSNYPEWFVVQSGPNVGLPRLLGWMRTPPSPATQDFYEVCPRCHAMVMPDSSWAHERWHSETDYPIPSHIAKQVIEWVGEHQ